MEIFHVYHTEEHVGSFLQASFSTKEKADYYAKHNKGGYPEHEMSVVPHILDSAVAAALSEGLDADAARYRWIRENISADLEWYLLGMHGMGADGLDIAIDAAITKAANPN